MRKMTGSMDEVTVCVFLSYTCPLSINDDMNYKMMLHLLLIVATFGPITGDH